MCGCKIISFTTDFGITDPFAGIMKGIILNRAPSARLVDITHCIEPQNIHQCYYAVKASVPYFPKGTIHLAVVDPGVGSERRPIAVQFQDSFFVGPDNGIFTFAFQNGGTVHEVTNATLLAEFPSNTFHGRDVFAPAAGALAAGMALEEVGPELNDPVQLTIQTPFCSEDYIKGEVIYIDHFGNSITNIENKMVQDLRKTQPGRKMVFSCQGRDGELVSNYSQGSKGAPCAVINSWNLLEIFLQGDNAHTAYNIQVGHDVLVNIQ